MVHVRYVGAHDAVYSADADAIVVRGGVIEVTPEVAGCAPSGDDLGTGLLAQPDNWLEVTPDLDEADAEVSA